MKTISEFFSDDSRIEAHVCETEMGTYSILFYEDGELVKIKNYPESSLVYLETVAENHVLGLKQSD